MLELDAAVGLNIPTHPGVRSALRQGNLLDAIAILAATSPSKRVSQIAHKLAQKLGDTFQDTVLADMADAFQTSYLVALGVLIFTFIPVAFLPRRKEEGLDAPQHAPLMH